MRSRNHGRQSRSNGERASGRVTDACARCRRQKLKCDATKPCTMCVHSGMQCQPGRVKIAGPPSRKKSYKPEIDGSDPTSPNRSQSTVTDTDMTAASSTVTASESISVPTPVDPSVDVVSSSSGSNVSTTVAQQFGANRSAMSLAVNVYENLGTASLLKTPTIPGDDQATTIASSPWRLRSMQMPPQSVMEALIDIYFDRMHWFISIFYEPSFIKQAHELLSATTWQRHDMGKVLATLMVAAVGLKCATQDTTLQGQQLLARISPEPQALIDQIVVEVRLHLFDLLDESCIEAVQVCSLLGTLYIFHGSPSLAWALIGLSVRASYALALHCDSDSEDPISTQIRRRCWNHVTVADTFASQIYGRPASIDPAFSDLLPLEEMDDDATIHLPSQSRSSATALTFHTLKFKLYEIIRKALTRFRVLHLHNPISVEDLRSLVDVVQHIDALLKQWREALPPYFDCTLWKDDDQYVLPEHECFEGHHAPGSSQRHLKMQALILQITYDAATILAHRPLLEYKLTPHYREGLSRLILESVSKSFDISVKAALRISRTPIMQLQNDFCIAFVFIHFFTAGVILCIPPTSHPFSSTSQEAKDGVLRIIQASKDLRRHCQIARHTERLLTDLLRLSLRREIDVFFDNDREMEHHAAPRQRLAKKVAVNGEHRQLFAPTTSIDGISRSSADENHFNCDQPQSMRIDGSNGGVHPHSADAPQFDGEWVEPYLFQHTWKEDGSSSRQQLDSQLSEAFGAFGQMMFNLMPDDPSSVWNWGGGSN